MAQLLFSSTNAKSTTIRTRCSSQSAPVLGGLSESQLEVGLAGRLASRLRSRQRQQFKLGCASSCFNKFIYTHPISKPSCESYALVHQRILLALPSPIIIILPQSSCAPSNLKVLAIGSLRGSILGTLRPFSTFSFQVPTESHSPFPCPAPSRRHGG